MSQNLGSPPLSDPPASGDSPSVSSGLEIRVARDAELFSVLKQQVATESGTLLHAPKEVRPQAESRWLCGPATDGALGIGLIAFKNNQPVGFAEALRQEMLMDCPTADLALGVVQSALREGVGRALMEVLESWATQIGLCRLQLLVLPDNFAAISLYESCGFEHNGKSANGLEVNSQLCTLLHMGKRLAGDERIAAEINKEDMPYDAHDARTQSEAQKQSLHVKPRPLALSDSERWRQMQPRLRAQTKWMARTLVALTFDKATAAEYCAHISNSKRFISYVAEPSENDAFIGSATGHFGSYQRDAHILTFGLIVDRSWWGHGIGDALLDSLETAASQRQAKRLSCDIAAGNQRALHFLQRHGYTVDARMPRATTIEGHAMDLLRLSKITA